MIHFQKLRGRQTNQWFDFEKTSVLSKQHDTCFWQCCGQRECSSPPFPLNVIEWGTMSQTAEADDSACPPLTKAVSTTTITRVLFTLLKQLSSSHLLFKRASPAKKYLTAPRRNHLAFDLALACGLWRPKPIFNLESVTLLWFAFLMGSSCLWTPVWKGFSSVNRIEEVVGREERAKVRGCGGGTTSTWALTSES